MSFTVFNFHPHIATAIQECGYTIPTPIQQQAIPPVLEGRDLLGLAQTGTGKTAAFVLPTLQRLLDGPRKSIRALIVAPTRELAEQIHSYIEKMAHMTNLRSAVIYGGVSKVTQVKKIRAGVEIIVACPGRLLDHMNDRAINLANVEILILDEADHMFDKGFLPDIRRILKSIPKKRQSLVFSATMPQEIRHLAEDILTNPATVQINHTKAAASISHALIPVEQKRKTDLLKNILEQKGMTTTLVFTKTKYKAKNVAQQLENSGYRATSLQGNLSQSKRQQALDGFKNGTYNILVATDIAARGIDVSGISHVINYDVPDTAEAYTHRTGRTGRAACTGEAFTFITADDDKIIKMIEQTLGKRILRESVSDFKLDAQDRNPTPKDGAGRSWQKKKTSTTTGAPKYKRGFGTSTFSKR
ncbi:MAG: DEAD/DEAH box helicase [Proteobacteria bacterium]|nr:DEAD/DEAH box helicase [Pseudomonadota bacterium]MBU1650524.1 DEAD/DEAH box helicase [Pseudomonadota bacterium]